MTIIRAPRPESGFTQIANETLRDSRLSYRARGILAAILSRPDNWRTNSESLAREGLEGREAIRTAMRELQAAGYLEVRQARGKNGQVTTEVIVYDRPTGDGFPGAGLPDAGFLGANRTQDTNTNYPPIVPQSQDLPAELDYGRRADPDAFDVFWQAYPRKAGKRSARAAWERALRRASAHAIIEGAAAYAADPNREPQFTAHAATWLNRDGWEDDPLPARAGRAPSATALYLGAADQFTGWDNAPRALEA